MSASIFLFSTIWGSQLWTTFLVLCVFLKDPQQSRNWHEFCHLFVLTWPDLTNEFGRTPKSKVKSLWQIPGFVISVLPCASCPALCVASLVFQAGHGPKASFQPLAPVYPWLQTLKWKLRKTYTSIQSGGPAASLSQGEELPFLSFSWTLDSHPDSMSVWVLFVFRIPNFFIIFFRFGLDFFL